MMKYYVIFFALFCAATSFAKEPQKVISIGGSNTEIIYALDAQDVLVGTDTTSYYPKAAEQLPKVGYQRMLSAEGVLSLNPDIIITTDEAGPQQVLKQIKAVGVDIVEVKAARNMDDVKANILQIANLLGKQEKARELIATMDSNYQKLQRVISKTKEKKRVMFILHHGSGAPLVAGGKTAADSIINLSGGLNVVEDYDGYKPLTPEAAVALRPEIILITTQGLKQIGGKASLVKIPGLSLTPAGQKGTIIAMDSLLLLGFSPRVIDAALALNHYYEMY